MMLNALVLRSYFSPGPVTKSLKNLGNSPDTLLTEARQACCGRYRAAAADFQVTETSLTHGGHTHFSGNGGNKSGPSTITSPEPNHGSEEKAQ
jgi:hypothetical protein